MPRPNYWLYEKKAPFRDAQLFVIICEGEKREPSYFQFFDGFSSRIKIVPIIPIDGKTSPRHLIDNAFSAKERLDLQEEDRLWFVFDTDRWAEAIHELREEVRKAKNWYIAQSNPSFEVWLYYHFESSYPNDAPNLKNLIHEMINGGFDCTKHPSLIKTACKNCKNNYKADGYLPSIGSSQVYLLAEQIIPLIDDELKKIADN